MKSYRYLFVALIVVLFIIELPAYASLFFIREILIRNDLREFKKSIDLPTMIMLEKNGWGCSHSLTTASGEFECIEYRKVTKEEKK